MNRVVPNSNHVSRYCGKGVCTENGWPTGAAFQLRQIDIDNALFVNWLEFLNRRTRDEEISEIQRILGLKLRRVGACAKLAVLNVGRVCKYVSENTPDQRMLKVLHEPEDMDPSHSGIHGLQPYPSDMLIEELIAEVVEEVYPARK